MVERVGLASRLATVKDARRIAEIYNQGILDRAATFETELRTVSSVRSWFDQPYPIVVVEAEGDVIAWASASTYRPRACYAGNAEFSVYVDRGWRGQGAGKAAILALIDASRKAGLEKLISRVFIENTASRRLLDSLGFREVGIYERHAKLDGVWRDVVIVERLLCDRRREPHGALWQPDPDTLALWDELRPGMDITVVKGPWEPDRSPFRYAAIVVGSQIPEPWIEVAARWVMPDVDVGPLRFETGSELREFFSPRHPFNAFGVYAPDGTFRGWYGNVTYPARLSQESEGLVLTWQDLILDLVAMPGGTVVEMDDEEIEESGFHESSPWIIDQMFFARDELRRMLKAGFFPTR